MSDGARRCFTCDSPAVDVVMVVGVVEVVTARARELMGPLLGQRVEVPACMECALHMGHEVRELQGKGEDDASVH